MSDESMIGSGGETLDGRLQRLVAGARDLIAGDLLYHGAAVHSDTLRLLSDRFVSLSPTERRTSTGEQLFNPFSSVFPKWLY